MIFLEKPERKNTFNSQIYKRAVN